MLPLEVILLGSAVLLLISVYASRIAARVGVPALLLFLIIGMVAGSEGLGGVYFDDAVLAQSLGSVALALILFSGGLDTNWRDIKPVLWQGVILATLGVIITAAAVGAFLHFVLGIGLEISMLTGSIVASTDAAAVFAMLGKNIGLKYNLKPLLQLESGSNDPMAILLTVSMIRLINEPTVSAGELIVFFIQQMGLGVLFGFGMAYVLVFIINRLRLEYDGLYPVVTLAFVFLIYGVTTIAGGNAFVALYLAGVVLANNDFIHKYSLTQFHDGLAWLMQIVMFLTLGLFAFPSQLDDVMVQGLLMAGFQILVARPLSVFISLLPFRMPLRQQLFISWVGLRGAAPIILATFPLVADVPGASTIFHLIFFVVITSVLLQGTTIRLASRLLDVDEVIVPPQKYPIGYGPAQGLKNALFEFRVGEGSPIAGKRIIDLHLPEETLIVLLARDEQMIVPKGSTVLQPNDMVLVLAEKTQRDWLEALFTASQTVLVPQE
ncbi:MAG: potassium/proton antiporter [Chloroflexota bacterium]|nr:MAG: potassium/proton antiporter [Chloroflexota bacterium]